MQRGSGPVGRPSVESVGGSKGNYDVSRRLRSFAQERRRFLVGESDPRRLLEQCLDAIAVRDGTLSAFCFMDVDGARQNADEAARRYKANRPLSPLDGCPLAIKDSINVRGMPTRVGTDLFGHEPARFDSACAYALRQAGVAIIGKTHVPEFCIGPPPATRNPFDDQRTAGGSSSGSGAAVGAGFVPVAIGNQTGGSLIRPASFNGCYGYKPSYGALNVGGMHPIASSQDHLGVLAASLEDAWTTAWEISSRIGGHNGHPGLSGSGPVPAARTPARLAFLETHGWRDIDDATRQAVDQLCGAIQASGVTILDRRNDEQLADFERLLDGTDEIFERIMTYEFRWPLLAYVDACGESAIGEAVRSRIARGTTLGAAGYREALAARDRVRIAARSFAPRVDAFLTLAASGPAPLLPSASGQARQPAHLATGSRSFHTPWSLVGGPSISLPLMSVDLLPLGLQVMGLPDDDSGLIAIARWIDELFG
jgi:Asp-tRNA(Asn)/Glu-tRNA(Gln) amidotransferase A subunit family amidase